MIKEIYRRNRGSIGMSIAFFLWAGSAAAYAANSAGQDDSPTSDLRSSFARDVAAAIGASIFSCPESVWPVTAWHRYQFLVADHISREAWLIRGNDPAKAPFGAAELSPLSYESLPLQFVQTSNSFVAGDFRGRPTIGVFRRRATDTVSDTMQFAVHEAFHFVGQTRFAMPAGPMQRGVILPENVQLRYLRRMLLISLKNALVRNGPLYMAAHWFQRIKGESNEVHRFESVDRREGSAEYAAAMAEVVGRAGCFASNARIAVHAAQLVADMWETRYSRLFEWSDDADSYALGAISGVLLQLRGIEGWQRRVEAGESMVAILLENVSPQAAVEDDGLRERIRLFYKARDEQFGRQLDVFTARLGSQDYAIVAIPATMRSGGYSLTGGFVSTIRDGRQLVLALGAHARFTLLESLGTVELRGQDFLFEAKAVCGPGRYLIFPVPRHAVAGKTTSPLSFSIDYASVERVGLERRNSEGMEWLCLQ